MRVDGSGNLEGLDGMTGPLVKICGNLHLDQSLAVAGEGPDLMGWIFAPISPRKIEPDGARSAIREIRTRFPEILHAGVFADNSVEEILEVVRRVGELDVVQTTGSPEMIGGLRTALGGLVDDGIRIPAIVPVVRVAGVTTDDDLREYGQVQLFVFDTYVKGVPGGTGQRFPLEWVAGVSVPYLLAGGLKAENLAGALAHAHPAGVDVSSGIEDAPGMKNPEKLKKFIEIARSFRSTGK